MEAARRRTPIRAEESAPTCEERNGGRGLTCSADADGISLFESMPLRVGDSVLIHSLRSSRRYNGVAAEVVASDAGDGDRVGVRLLHGTCGRGIPMETAELSLRGCRNRDESRLDAVVSTAKPLPAFGARRPRCVSPSRAHSTSSDAHEASCWRLPGGAEQRKRFLGMTRLCAFPGLAPAISQACRSPFSLRPEVPPRYKGRYYRHGAASGPKLRPNVVRLVALQRLLHVTELLEPISR